MRRITLLIAMMLSLGATALYAQRTYALSSAEVTIAGTSTLHDWESVVEQVKGQALIQLEGNELTAIKSLRIDFVVESIKSGKTQMDRNTYKALKAEAHPLIRYELKRIEGIQRRGTSWEIQARGKLSIAGVSREIPLSVQAAASKDGRLKMWGQYELNMLDYQVEPPTAMMGAIKTGEKVTITFTIEMKPSDFSTTP